MNTFRKVLKTIFMFSLLLLVAISLDSEIIDDKGALVNAEEVNTSTSTLKENTYYPGKMSYVADSTNDTNKVVQVLSCFNDGTPGNSYGIWTFDSSSSQNDGWVVMKSENGPMYLNAYSIFAAYELSGTSYGTYYTPKGWELYGSNSYNEQTIHVMIGNLLIK